MVFCALTPLTVGQPRSRWSWRGGVQTHGSTWAVAGPQPPAWSPSSGSFKSRVFTSRRLGPALPPLFSLLPRCVCPPGDAHGPGVHSDRKGKFSEVVCIQAPLPQPTARLGVRALCAPEPGIRTWVAWPAPQGLRTPCLQRTLLLSSGLALGRKASGVWLRGKQV